MGRKKEKNSESTYAIGPSNPFALKYPVYALQKIVFVERKKNVTTTCHKKTFPLHREEKIKIYLRKRYLFNLSPAPVT